MQVISQIEPLKEILRSIRTDGRSIGFVPTMGALHAGHLSLIQTSIKDNSITVASVYVNPTQFNDMLDLKNYPRDIERDKEMLSSVGCDIVFVPSDSEMYPSPDVRAFDFGSMGEVMEGVHRPGHFNGVAQIVSKLFDIVEPDTAYFGQKDFQQLAIIRKLASDFNYNIKIVGCAIVRDRY